MSPAVVFLVLVLYFGVLFFISRLTSRNATVDTFFTGNRQSPWYVVAFGMIGASLSGITFVSVPGEVGNSHLYYFQLVLGYLVGYALIALVLLPLYYRLRLVSIYGYLGSRFGGITHRTGSLLFLVSQSIGASLRLFVVAGVLHAALFPGNRIPFMFTVVATIALIWAYTNKAGIRTIVWTDTFQTAMMLLSVLVSIAVVASHMDLTGKELVQTLIRSEHARIFNWEWRFERNFFKQFITGVVVALAMNGLDQNEMQKSLTCRNLRDAQKNIVLYSVFLVMTNLVFLSLGVLLYAYVAKAGLALPVGTDGAFLNTDGLFPMLALGHFGPLAGIVFMLGIASAAFSSADSALTSLTTAVYTDFWKTDHKTESERRTLRNRINVGVALVLVSIILVFKVLNNDSVINTVFTVAGYTYGPLLGIFFFGLLTRHSIRERMLPVVIVLSPCAAFLVQHLSLRIWDFHLGFTLLLLNGLLNFAGLWIIRRR